MKKLEADKWRTKGWRWTQENIETLSLEGKEENKEKIRAQERKRWKKSIPQEMWLLSVIGGRDVSLQTAGNESLTGQSWMTLPGVWIKKVTILLIKRKAK